MRQGSAGGVSAVLMGVGCVAQVALGVLAVYLVATVPAWSMLIPLSACWAFGRLFSYAFALQRPFLGKKIYEAAMVALVLVLAMANLRGFYWNIFGAGSGFFTANRISANLVFLITVFATVAANGPRSRALAGDE